MPTSPNVGLRSFGSDQEEIALNMLLEKGYHLVKKNFHFGRSGEIDLVMRDGETWVFVEVKARRSHEFGLPEDSITPRKRSQIRRVALGFAHVMKLEEYEARFDVVAVDYVAGDDGKPEIRHHVDAFS